MKRIYYYERKGTLLHTLDGTQPGEWYETDEDAIRGLKAQIDDLMVIYRYAHEDPNDHTFKVIWESEVHNNVIR